MSSVSPSEHESQKALPAHAGPDAGPRKGSKFRVALYILIAAGAIGYAAWQIHENAAQMQLANQRTAAAADRATPIQAAVAVQKTMPIYLTALGSVTAYNTVTIKTNAGKEVKRLADALKKVDQPVAQPEGEKQE